MGIDLKKVAIVTNSAQYAWHMRTNLARAFQKKSYEVVFITPYHEKYSELIKNEFNYVNIDFDAKGFNPFSDIKILYQYYKLYKSLKPDIILHYTIKPNIYGTIIAGFLKIPAINNIAGLGTLFIQQNLVTRIAKMLYKLSQKKATKVFFQNSDDYIMFTSEGLVDKEKCDILPGSGVDIDKFKPVTLRNEDNTFKFLLIARMLWAKGIQEYIDAARIIKKKYGNNVEFYLLGALDVDSPTAISSQEMDKWIEEGIVQYLGVSDNVNDEIAKVDCVVLPSYYREGTPRSLLESASMAKPIITTDNVGCKDVVDDGVNGYLCQKQSSQDLANKMEQMLKLSDEERTTMGENGRMKILKEFDEKIVINKYLDAINKILS